MELLEILIPILIVLFVIDFLAVTYCAYKKANNQDCTLYRPEGQPLDYEVPPENHDAFWLGK